MVSEDLKKKILSGEISGKLKSKKKYTPEEYEKLFEVDGEDSRRDI